MWEVLGQADRRNPSFQRRMKDCDLGMESGGAEDEVRGSGADLRGESELRMEDKATRLIGVGWKVG